jgi:hypothetical protein
MSVAVAFEEAAASVRERHRVFTCVQRHALDEALLFEVIEISIANFESRVAVAQVPLGYDAESANSRECAHIGLFRR